MLRSSWSIRPAFDQPISGQFASTSLISSEQLAIGGWNTVRGYDERVLFGDQGFVINIELHTPSFSPSSWISGKLPKDDLQFLAFWDFGLMNTIDPSPGDPSPTYLTGIGVGARYNVGSNLAVRCDVGFPLYNPDLGFTVDAARASVGVTLGF
jgi:hemolysin activation/secretion protein